MASTRLPRIDIRDQQHDEEEDNEEMQETDKPTANLISPFRLPTDDEVFLYRETEKQKRNQEKKQSRGQKIWDKKTTTSRQPLQLFRHTEIESNELQEKPQTSYNARDKTLISRALEAVKEREKNREHGPKKKEGIVELVDQKKEMFLVEMTVGIIDKEIDRLKRISGDKQNALSGSKRMLEADHEHFSKYVEANDRSTKFEEKKAEEEEKRKREKDVEIKSLQQKLTALESESGKRNEEKVMKYKEAKDFLDKLTPPEFIAEKNKKIEEKLAQLRQEYVDREMGNISDVGSDEMRSIGAFPASVSSRSNQTSRIARNETRDQARKTLQTQLEEKFNRLYEEGAIARDEIERFEDDYPLYFEDKPEKILEIFDILEEKKFFLLQMMQDTEQSVEELNSGFNSKLHELNFKIGNLKETQSALERAIREKESKLHMLEHKKQENSTQSRHDNEQAIRKHVVGFFNDFKDDMGMQFEIDSKTTLEVLASIEMHLEKKLTSLRNYSRNYNIEEMKKRHEANRRKEEHNRKARKMEEENRQRANTFLQRIAQPAKKRIGRRDMKKSAPLEKKKQVKVEVKINEDEEDQKYFRPMHLSQY